MLAIGQEHRANPVSPIVSGRKTNTPNANVHSELTIWSMHERGYVFGTGRNPCPGGTGRNFRLSRLSLMKSRDGIETQHGKRRSEELTDRNAGTRRIRSRTGKRLENESTCSRYCAVLSPLHSNKMLKWRVDRILLQHRHCWRHDLSREIPIFQVFVRCI